MKDKSRYVRLAHAIEQICISFGEVEIVKRWFEGLSPQAASTSTNARMSLM